MIAIKKTIKIKNGLISTDHEVLQKGMLRLRIMIVLLLNVIDVEDLFGIFY